MRYLTFILVFIPFVIFGQITIQAADMSDGGDTSWVTTTMDPNIDFLTTGANQVWDYSSLTGNGQKLIEYFNMADATFTSQAVFGMFASSDYQATNFKSSTDIPLDQLSAFLPVSITDIFAFSKNTVDSITSVGYSVMIEGFEVPFKSDTIETRYKFPLNYGDSYNSKGYSELDMNPIYNGIWVQYRERSSTVDGWGTITTPYGTFDALRIDHFIQETDSIFMEIFGNGTWIPLPIPDSHEYEWWTNGEKEPLLRISTSDIQGTETVTSVEYRDFLLSSGIKELDQDLTLFPNPTTDYLKVNGLSNPCDFLIISPNGKIVKTGSISEQIDVSDIDKGEYILILYGFGMNRTYPFIKN